MEAKPVVLSETLKSSFLSSFLILSGYTVITLVEAIRATSPQVRHIMNLETAISMVAGFTYNLFMEKIKEPHVDLQEINQLRYVDWSITTPLILLALILFYNPNYKTIHYTHYLSLVALNAGMLAAGYLGERGVISRITGTGIGFAFFAALLGLLFSCCIPKGMPMAVFYVFAIIWSLYGVVYMLEDPETKNVAYNVLDVISKALFGVFLWLYFGKVINFDS